MLKLLTKHFLRIYIHVHIVVIGMVRKLRIPAIVYYYIIMSSYHILQLEGILKKKMPDNNSFLLIMSSERDIKSFRRKLVDKMNNSVGRPISN